MSMTKNELESYFLSHNYPRYEREGWDNYCEAVGLNSRSLHPRDREQRQRHDLPLFG
jgi:hypothetical protein